MALYDRVSDLGFQVEGYDLELHEMETSSGFTRVSTVISLHGDGKTGRGEDVTYESEEHHEFVDSPTLDLKGEHTIKSFSRELDEKVLFPNDPESEKSRSYRRWAFESAALDLALKQAGTNLSDALKLEYDPVRFVVSTRLGDPPSAERIEEWLSMNPDLEFKLDPTDEWTLELIEEVAETDSVRVLDLKSMYEGTEVDQEPDPELYRWVIKEFPDAIIEDPAFTEETKPLFEGHKRRVSWDYPITGVESIESLPFKPHWLNIKPSRFGTLRSLFDSIDYCIDNGINMYGGGQFELDVGREHIHALASLFYPNSPNDVAPSGYNAPEPKEGLPTSPLSPPTDPRGLEW
ncbi:MAG: hypothetical protein SV377_08140 [Halobacteria archaeon]|nr:hypothetical protein [Halobacteria archaeon]